MGEYTGKCCKKAGEIAVMEVGKGSVATRGREVTDVGFSKRRKVVSNVELVSHHCVLCSPEYSVSSSTAAENYDHSPASQCFRSKTSEVVKGSLRSVDLKMEAFKIENYKLINGRFSKEPTPTSELCADSAEELEPTKSNTSPARLRRKPPPTRMPSRAEIEEFFSIAEKQEQKRFAEKYNYDVVKDVPLEGRYQWVRLKP